MEHIKIDTTQNVNINQQIASVGDRILATFIDLFILISYILVVGYFIIDKLTPSSAVIIIIFSPVVLYHLLFEIFTNGQSIGKKAVGLKVIKIDGSQPTIGNYFIRWIFRLVDIVIVYGIVATVTAVISKKGQRFGDMVARTTVINIRNTMSLKDTIFTSTPKDHIVKYPEAKYLTDKDIHTTKEVLSFFMRNSNKDNAVQMLFELQKELSSKLGVTPTEPPVVFLKHILQDYSYLHQ